jgi:DNA-directed RNA polymerase sigma subunit (sigma70/sigma32)
MIPDFEKMSEIEIARTLSPLNRTERSVIRLRFGIPGGYLSTLEEVGQALGMSREVISHTELQAMIKLGWLKLPTAP